MAKTIMISNDAYEKLKYLKERANKSFTEVIIEFIDNSRNVKTIGGLRKFYGILKDDKEYDGVMKEAKKGWNKWTKKYV